MLQIVASLLLVSSSELIGYNYVGLQLCTETDTPVQFQMNNMMPYNNTQTSPFNVFSDE